MVIRELGGVIGVAVLGSVFAAHGSTAAASAFLAGFRPALLAGAAIAVVGALAATSLPGARGSCENRCSTTPVPRLN